MWVGGVAWLTYLGLGGRSRCTAGEENDACAHYSAPLFTHHLSKAPLYPQQASRVGKVVLFQLERTKGLPRGRKVTRSFPGVLQSEEGKDGLLRSSGCQSFSSMAKPKVGGEKACSAHLPWQYTPWNLSRRSLGVQLLSIPPGTPHTGGRTAAAAGGVTQQTQVRPSPGSGWHSLPSPWAWLPWQWCLEKGNNLLYKGYVPIVWPL